MQTYLVGGAVRDTLLGLPVQDRDWVVVGATPEQLVARGFLPVGRDFPVFLHPQTREEHALARTERKTAPGYRGFVVHADPDVTLEQDLERRDLTVNAMAVDTGLLDAHGNFDPEQTELVDPFGGRSDLSRRVLRHVSDAFREDPVRILRVARFAARFADFRLADDTLALMRAMVAHGDAGHLVAERVWQELARGLMEHRPSRMVEVLEDCHALPQLLPELAQPWPADAAMTRQAWLHMLDHAHDGAAGLPLRFACLCLPVSAPAQIERLCERLRVPHDGRDLALLAAREQCAIDQSRQLDAEALVQLLERCDAFRKPGRFAELLRICQMRAAAHAPPPPPPSGNAYAPRVRLSAALAAALAVDSAAVARRAQQAGRSGPQVGAAIREERIAAVAACC